jgi:hypothetical protein
MLFAWFVDGEIYLLDDLPLSAHGLVVRLL